MKVKCPRCKEEFLYYERTSRPFCSERCRNHDFVAWLEEEHAIPSREQLNEQDVEFILKARKEHES